MGLVLGRLAGVPATALQLDVVVEMHVPGSEDVETIRWQSHKLGSLA